MYIKTFPMQPYGVNSYLAWNADGAALAVDCGGQPEVLLEHLQAYSLELTVILLTHLHHDHVLGVATLAAKTGAPVFASAADAGLVETDSDSPATALPAVPPFAFKDIRCGRATFLGEPCLVLPVPGHTPGHLAYFFPKTLTAFTGDTLFRGSVGRTDSPYGDASLLLESIRSRLLVLPDAVELFPGHGPSTTVGREKAENPFFASK